MPEFKIHSEFKITGDQPQAVETLANGILQGKRAQTLMGGLLDMERTTIASSANRVSLCVLLTERGSTLRLQACYSTILQTHTILYSIISNHSFHSIELKNIPFSTLEYSNSMMKPERRDVEWLSDDW